MDMNTAVNIYCDESRHLENDGHDAMVLGAVMCPAAKAREIAVRLREIKRRHGLSPELELKWTKVSAGKLLYYLDVVDYFFDDDDLHFRALIADKRGLRHEDFAQDHDTWYYKMYFDLLKILLKPNSEYRIFVDVKDTRTGRKLRKLHEVLCNNIYDFDRRIISTVQGVGSHEVQQVQLADLLIGAVGYAKSDRKTSIAKAALVDRIRQRSGYSLSRTTLIREDKLNLFHWSARSV
jgi:hypothetical protein